MKTLKSLLASLAITASLFTTSTGWAQKPEPVVDSEAVARSFLRNVPSYFIGDCYMRLGTNEHDALFTMNMDGQITSLTLDGENIPIPPGKPLRGLPRLLNGELDYIGINFNAFGADGQSVGNGYFWSDIFRFGQPINFELWPNLWPAILRYSGPDPSGNTLEVIGSTRGWWSYWNQDLGAYIVWVDPTSPPTPEYILRDSAGNIIQTGMLNVWDQIAQSSGNSPINMSLPGHVEYVALDDRHSWKKLPLAFDSSIYRAGQQVSGKVLLMDNSGNTSRTFSIYIGWVNSGVPCTVEVRQEIDGVLSEIPVVATFIPLSENPSVGYWHFEFNSQPGRNLSVTVLGDWRLYPKGYDARLTVSEGGGKGRP